MENQKAKNIIPANQSELPNYSVILSIYSKVDPVYLKESIDSILNQTYKTNEFIIVKDGPLTDEQEELLQKVEEQNKNIVKIYALEKNQGAGVAYNLANTKVTNTYAAVMDSDDIADTTKFEKQMNYIKEHPEIDAVGTNAIEFIDTKDNVISRRYMPEFHEDIVKFAKSRCPMIHPTVVFKVDAVRESGNYRSSPLTEDYDMYIRMIQKGYKFYTYQEILYYIRTSEDFFSRRGGLKYVKPILSFKWKHYKDGFYSFKDFFKTSCASLAVSLMPNFLRTKIYKKFLRNN